jgi:mutator protein MutT
MTKYKKNYSGAIIIWNNKILLFHRENNPNISNPDSWSLPGGKSEKGETPLQTLDRELVEEISHTPKEKHLLKTIDHNGRKASIYYSFVDDSEAKMFKHHGNEGQEIAFFTLDEIKKLKLSKFLRNKFKLVNHEIKRCIVEKSFDNFKI